MSGMCYSLSCAILLAALHESLGLLIVLRNLTEGVVLSSVFIFLPLGDCSQSAFHLMVRLSLYALFAAAGLMSRGFLRSGGSSLANEVLLLAAFLASLSAFSLPSIPQWPADHLSVNLSLRLPQRFCIRFAKLRNSHAMRCPGRHMSKSKALSAAWLSTAMRLGEPLRFLVVIRWSANSMPTGSTS